MGEQKNHEDQAMLTTIECDGIARTNLRSEK
jgi:hypothetical protein